MSRSVLNDCLDQARALRRRHKFDELAPAQLAELAVAARAGVGPERNTVAECALLPALRSAKALAARYRQHDEHETVTVAHTAAVRAAERWDPALGPLGATVHTIIQQTAGYRAARHRYRPTPGRSLDAPPREGGTGALGDTLSAAGRDPLSVLLDAETRERVLRAVLRLGLRDRQIAALRLGLWSPDASPMQSPEVARTLGITRGVERMAWQTARKRLALLLREDA